MTDPQTKTKAPKPKSLPTTPTETAQDHYSNTQELEDHLEEEQEFYEAVEEIEHNLGVNASMVDWYNVNFESSFSNTGEFTNRAAVVPQTVSCDDCKVNSTTFEKQRELLLKQDKQIQESHRIQKESRNEIKKLKNNSKALESRLKETTSMLETVLEESTAEIATLKAELKVKDDLIKVAPPKTAQKTQHNMTRDNNEIQIDLEKCKVCGFSSESKIVMRKHMEGRHNAVQVFNCLMCPEVSNIKQRFREHKARHQSELDVIEYHRTCTDCNITFKSRDEKLEHLLAKHRPQKGAGEKSIPSHAKDQDECKNGPSCQWLKNNRCSFKHSEQPWQTVHHRRHKQQSKQQSQHQQKQHSQQQSRQQKQPRSFQQEEEMEHCWNGLSCKFQKQGRCKFSHEKSRYQQKKQAGRQSRASEHNHSDWSSQLKPCKFGNRCDKGMSCTYLHLPKDFLSSKGGRRQ